MSSRSLTRWVAAVGLLLGVAILALADDDPPAPEPRPRLDVERLFKTALIIDGVANHYSPSSGVGQPDFTTDARGLSVKQATGIDVGSLTTPSLRAAELQVAAVSEGRFKAADYKMAYE